MNKTNPTNSQAKKAEVRGRLFMSVGTVLFIYVVVSTGQALWQNYSLNQELGKLREKNAELKLRNNYLQNLIAYRRTDAFKDKEARSKLNYQKEGEVVLIIPDDGAQRFVEGNVNNRQVSKPRELTNPEKWWNLFFGPPTNETSGQG